MTSNKLTHPAILAALYLNSPDPKNASERIADLNYWLKSIELFSSSAYFQSYFNILVFLVCAVILASLMVTIAYLLSLSSTQDSEKRSEYECGFEPFDSATRLPFDVHFYLVGILFLIFDVEIALLFPWVMGLNTCTWFAFYLVLGFIILLAVGFFYEWKRGALIWPFRQQEQLYVPASQYQTQE